MPNSNTSKLSPEKQYLLKHVLMGTSSLDWPALHFKDLDEVNHFLKINEFDIKRPSDLTRLRSIYTEALNYVQSHFELSIPKSLKQLENLQNLFLGASQNKDSELQKASCSILKAMNVINHIDGRELLYHCQLSSKNFTRLTQDKIERTLSSLKSQIASL